MERIVSEGDDFVVDTLFYFKPVQSMIMSSIGKHTEASSSEAEFGRVRDDERPSPRSEVVVASTDTGTRPVKAHELVMAAAEALLKYASVGRTDNDRESAQWGSAEAN